MAERSHLLPFLAAALLAFGFVAPPAAADEPDPLLRAREAHAWLLEVRATRSALLQALAPMREEATNEARKAAHQALARGILERLAPLEAEAEKDLREAFAPLADGDLDLAVDERLVAEGLSLLAEEALDADPARAVHLWERLVALLPAVPEATHARNSWLPIALPATGDLDRARTRLLELADQADEGSRPGLLVAVGDVDAVAGAYDAARARYEEAAALIPADADRADPRGRLAPHLDLRRRLVGRPAPEVDGATWLGAPPRPLSSLRGSVVLLDYWATW
jgi:hypothetical protein